MCSPSGDTNDSNAMWSSSRQRFITSKRRNRSTSSCFAVVAISSTMGPTSGFTITFGANCGSISTTSAPMARIFLRPSLPQDQVGLRGHHGLIEALEHVTDFLAVNAAIEHGDRTVWETLLELFRETIRIIRRWRTRAHASGRRRTDGDDGDRTAGRELLRKARQWIGKSEKIERRFAFGRRCFSMRRKRHPQADDERGDNDRFHRPMSEINTLHRSFLHPDYQPPSVCGSLAWPPQSRNRPVIDRLGASQF